MDDKQTKPERLGTSTPEPPKTINVNVTVPPAEKYVYSNVAGVAVSPWDFRINFAVMQPVGDKIESHNVVGVVLPAEHAASLTMLMIQQLRNFEKAYGNLRNPEWELYRELFNTVEEAATTVDSVQSASVPEEK
jgi:hypothetical protein